MKHGPIALTVSLVFVVGLALSPAAAMAGRSHGRAVSGVHAGARQSGVHHGRGIHHIAPRPHPGVPHHVGSRPFVRHVRPFGVIAGSIIYGPSPLWYGPPVSYDPVSYDPSASYGPPVSYGPTTGGTISVAPSPPLPPTPNVIEYPTGRYELRGDGVTTPYTWVWIPNPPPPPPSAAPHPGEPSPARHTQLYRWTDEEGVAHWTDRWDAVPQPYRAQARQPRLP